MFLVKDRRLGMDNYVFTNQDPRSEGFQGDVVEGVALDYDMNDIHLWPQGQPRPNPQLGRDPKKPKHYQVFKFPDDLQAAGFELVHFNTPFFAYSWSEYRKRYYPVPEEYAKKMTPDEWFDYLEEADSATSIRKKLNEPLEPKPGSTRDEIAKWVANRHVGADGGIQQVWYLPFGSPADEIRLLEISERYTGEPDTIEPVAFGLNVGDADYRLAVADVSRSHLERIQHEPARLLPMGWRLQDSISWGRRELGQ